MEIQEFLAQLQSVVNRGVNKADKPESISQEDWDKMTPEEQEAAAKKNKAEVKPEEKNPKEGYGYPEMKALVTNLEQMVRLAGDSALVKSVIGLQEDVTTLKKVMEESVLPILEKLAERSAVRKSIPGDDQTPVEKSTDKRKVSWDETIRRARRDGTVILQ